MVSRAVQFRFTLIFNTPDMHVMKMCLCGLSLEKKINRCQHATRRTGHVVVIIHRVVHCHGPEIRFYHACPTNCSMHENCAGFRKDALNGMLSNAILMMGSDTAELDVLHWIQCCLRKRVLQKYHCQLDRLEL